MIDARAIVRLVRGASEPMRLAEIASALRLPHGAALRDEVGRLVRDGQLIRHHDPSGFLRYSATGTAPTRSPSVRCIVTGPIVDGHCSRVVDALRARGGWIRPRTLRSALDDLTYAKFSYALSVLCQRGVVERLGRSSACRVRLAAAASDAESVQVSAIDGRNLNETSAANPDFVLDALRHAVTSAQSALDAYLARREPRRPS